MVLTFEVKYDNEVTENEWNGILEKNENATAFQSYNWAILYKEVFNSIPVFIYIKNGTNVVAQLAASIHSDYYTNKVNSLFRIILKKLDLKIMRWKYGPIIHDKKLTNEIHSKILEALDEVSKENNVDVINGRYPALGSETQSPPNELLIKNNYNVDSWSTYIVDLTQHNSDKLFSSLDKKIRYDIRKGQNKGLEFEARDDIQSLEQLLQMKKNDSLKNDIGILDKAHFKNMITKKMEKIFFATKDTNPKGAIRCLLFNGNLIQQGVTTTPEGRLLQAGSFVTWNAIKWTKENNCKTFDMGGANPSDTRSEKEYTIDFYKSKWKGDMCTYTICNKISNSFKYKIFRLMMYLGKRKN